MLQCGRTAPCLLTGIQVATTRTPRSGTNSASHHRAAETKAAQPATWHLLEAGPRQVLREDLGCDDLEWERGKAWAFEQAMGLVWYYAETNPAMSRMGRRTLERIVADWPGAMAVPGVVSTG